MSDERHDQILAREPCPFVEGGSPCPGRVSLEQREETCSGVLGGLDDINAHRELFVCSVNPKHRARRSWKWEKA